MADINIMVSAELDTEPKNSKEVKSHFGAMTANVDVHIFTVPKKKFKQRASWYAIVSHVEAEVNE